MNRGVTEEVYKTYATSKINLGSIIESPRNKWVFCKNGASILGQGLLCQGPLPVTNVLEMVCDVARAIGSKTISATLAQAVAVVQDQYKDGFIWVNKNTGAGNIYRIKGHAAAAASAVVTFQLYEDTPVLVALVASSSEVTCYSKYSGVLVHDSPPTAPLVGVTMCAVPASYYFWACVKGPCAVLGSGTLVIGDQCVPSASVDGAVMPSAASETDGPYCGIVATVNITGEVSLIELAIFGA